MSFRETRVEIDRRLQLGDPPLELHLDRTDTPQNEVCEGIPVVDSDGPFRQFESFPQCLLASVGISVNDVMVQHVSRRRAGLAKLFVDLDGLSQIPQGFVVVLACVLIEMPDALQIEIPGIDVGSSVGLQALPFGPFQLGLEAGGDPPRDIVLQVEEVVQFAIVELGPELFVAGRVYQDPFDEMARNLEG